jgi:hypothetical protein
MLPGGRLDELCERAQSGDILSICRKSTLVSATRLGANERLRRTLTLRDVRHVEAVPFDLSMQMGAPVLAHVEPMRLPLRIGGEDDELAAVRAVA